MIVTSCYAHILMIEFVEMWKVRGADRIAQAETTVDLSRRSIQWKTYKNSSFSWKEVSGYVKAGDFQDTGTSSYSYLSHPPTLPFGYTS